MAASDFNHQVAAALDPSRAASQKATKGDEIAAE